MPPYQTTYSEDIPKGFPGMVAQGGPSDRISREVEDAAGIGFGVAVFRGTGDRQITATPSADFVGVTIVDKTTAGFVSGTVVNNGAAADNYPQKSTAAVMVRGVIWVTAGANVAAGAQVYVTSAGAYTSVATGNQIMDGWFFEDTVSSGAIVRIARR